MASSGFIAGLVVAFFGAAIGALLGQFLRYYRQKREEMEKLISVLKWLEKLETSDYGANVDDSDSHLSKIYDSLYDAVQLNHQYLSDEAEENINEIIIRFAALRGHRPSVNHKDTVHFNNHAEKALQYVEQVSIWQCARQFFSFR